MSLAVVYSRATRGLEAAAVSVEVHIAPGLPKLHIVGLPEKAVKESKYRVRAAISQSRFDFPMRRITVSLAPADLPKDGGRFDLPIALGILAAANQIPTDALKHCEFLAELGLDGGLRPVRGILPAALATAKCGRTLVIAQDNALEASLIRGAKVCCGDNLLDVCGHLSRGEGLQAVKAAEIPRDDSTGEDLADVYGQHHAVRALEVAAAGGHHCLLLGSPGSGKTMLASRLPGILPAMSEEEALQTMAIRSLCTERVELKRLYRRPFRAPHHSASAAALAGGGSDPKPGEITKAHNGVLFLDELPEFTHQALEILREPLETGRVHLSRATASVEYPARFQLIAAMNPCPNGEDVDERGECPGSQAQLRRYYARLSAPLLDRIDIQVRVPRVKWSGDTPARPGESSAAVRARVLAACRRQSARQGGCNAHIRDADVKRLCALSRQDMTLLCQAVERLGLSARALNRMLKVSRTIADLAGEERIARPHLLEAIAYRSMDRLFRV